MQHSGTSVKFLEGRTVIEVITVINKFYARLSNDSENKQQL